MKKCAREDSNFHDLNGHWPLKPARLPIPPRAQKRIANVIKKSDETAPHEVILVLDATSGQNIVNQLEEFNKIK